MPKSKVRKKTAYTMGSVGRTPVKVGAGPTPTWYVVAFCSLFILGIIWMVLYYLAATPSGWGAEGKPFHWMAQLDIWNYAIGFGMIVVGLLMAMRWR